VEYYNGGGVGDVKFHGALSGLPSWGCLLVVHRSGDSLPIEQQLVGSVTWMLPAMSWSPI